MMDVAGNRLIEPLYDGIYGDWNTNDHEGPYFSNHSDRDLAMTAMHDYDSGHFGIISFDGEELVPPISKYYLSVSANGMVPVLVGDKWGYIQI
jgi:hypothetical protein